MLRVSCMELVKVECWASADFFLILSFFSSCRALAVVPSGVEFTSAYSSVPHTSLSGFSGQKSGGVGAYELRLKGKWDPQALAKGVAILGDDPQGRYTLTHFGLPVPSFCAAATLYPACPDTTITPGDCRAPPTSFDEKVVSPACPHDVSYRSVVKSDLTADKTYSFGFNVVNTEDLEAPSFQNQPSNQVFEACSGFAAPNPGNLTATDNCSPDQEVAPCSHRENGTCPNEYILTFTWTAVDDCGQTKCRTTKYSVQDNTPPTIVGVTTNNTAECGAVLPDPPVVTATDCCGDAQCAVEVTNSTQEYPDCGLSKVVATEFTACDDCGNCDTKTYVLIIRDSTAPQITFDSYPEPSVDIFCDEQMPVINAHCTDACVVGEFPANYSDTTEPGACSKVESIITRTWFCCDECGLRSEPVTQLVHVKKRPPDLDQPPA